MWFALVTLLALQACDLHLHFAPASVEFVSGSVSPSTVAAGSPFTASGTPVDVRVGFASTGATSFEPRFTFN